MKRILIISQVRYSSTRLYGKVLKKVLDKPILWYLIKRLEQVKTPNKLILAIANTESDQAIINFAKKLNVDYIVGSETDVLDRTYQAAKEFKGDIIVRITSDCPLSDPEIIDKALKIFFEGGCDYLTTGYPQTYPTGFDVEIFTFKTLGKAWNEAKDLNEREHVTLYLLNHPEKFVKRSIDFEIDLSSLTFELDTYEDFLFLSKIIEEFHDRWLSFRMLDVIVYLKENPNLLKINSQYERNIDMIKNLKIN